MHHGAGTEEAVIAPSGASLPDDDSLRHKWAQDQLAIASVQLAERAARIAAIDAATIRIWLRDPATGHRPVQIKDPAVVTPPEILSQSSR